MFGVALLLLGAAAVSYLRSDRTADEPPFAVAPLAIDLGSVPAGDRTLDVTLTNPADRSRRVIGLAEG
jgi:hypothetical protein